MLLFLLLHHCRLQARPVNVSGLDPFHGIQHRLVAEDLPRGSSRERERERGRARNTEKEASSSTKVSARSNEQKREIRCGMCMLRNKVAYREAVRTPEAIVGTALERVLTFQCRCGISANTPGSRTP